MRGEYAAVLAPLRNPVRFTPTCVGNTRFVSVPASVGTVHPHVRGEYLVDQLSPIQNRGSPPRAWGIPRLLVSDALASAVHPHVRGEYAHGTTPQPMMSGSPPRAWGILRHRRRRVGKLRFTPTCVGNTEPPQRRRGGDSVHPHVRGEYVMLIPTVEPFTVHPHVRGEYLGQADRTEPITGSPPRAWGIPLPLAVSRYIRSGSPPRAWGIRSTPRSRDVKRRFTPTCVGNTARKRNLTVIWAVHPHVRGEYGLDAACIPDGIGSPPRAWGIRKGPTPVRTYGAVHPHVRGEYYGLAFQRGGDGWFTPTCVGNTLSFTRR